MPSSVVTVIVALSSGGSLGSALMFWRLHAKDKMKHAEKMALIDQARQEFEQTQQSAMPALVEMQRVDRPILVTPRALGSQPSASASSDL